MIPGIQGINSFANQSSYPWMNNPNITDAWIAERDYLTFGTGVSAWKPQKGSIILTQGTTSAQPVASQFGSKNLSSFTFDGVDDHLIGDALATKVAGTNVPFTTILSLQFLAAPAVAKYFMLWGKTASSTLSFHGYYYNPARTFSVQRQKDTTGGALNVNSTQTLTVGGNAVLTYFFTGTSIVVRLNAVQTSISTAFVAGGPVTPDNFTLAAGRNGGTPNTFGNWKCRSLIFSPIVLAPSDYVPIENYLMSEF